MMDKPEDATLPPTEREEAKEMATVQCPACIEHNRRGGYQRFPTIIVGCARQHAMPEHAVMLEGIITCLFDGHKRPIRLIDDVIDSTSPTLPISDSTRLTSGVPAELKEDVEEAEQCHFASCHKAAVVMCRRAVQLGLITLGVQDGPLHQMFTQASQTIHPKDSKRNILTTQTKLLAEGVKEFGDVAAHRKADINPQDVVVTVYATVNLLNDMFP